MFEIRSVFNFLSVFFRRAFQSQNYPTSNQLTVEVYSMKMALLNVHVNAVSMMGCFAPGDKQPGSNNNWLVRCE